LEPNPAPTNVTHVPLPLCWFEKKISETTGTLYDNTSVRDECLSPVVITMLMDVDTPAGDLQVIVELDTHNVFSHPVDPMRAAPLWYSNCNPDPHVYNFWSPWVMTFCDIKLACAALDVVGRSKDIDSVIEHK